MSKKMEGKQSTQSVIARLMGLDELPPQQPSNRQLKVLSDDYLRKSASIGVLDKSSLLVSRLSRKTAEKQRGVKPVFDNEIPKTEKRSTQLFPDLKPNQGTVRAQFSFARQQNRYAKKYHLVDKNLCHAEALNDVLEDVHVARDNSLRYFNQSNLSTKLLHDSKALELHMRFGCLTAPIITSVPAYKDSDLSNKSSKASTERNVLKSIQKLENNCGESDTDYLDEFSKTHSDLKDNEGNFSTRIVVLKPNSRKTQNSVMDLLLQRSDINCQLGLMEDREHRELLKCRSRDVNSEATEIEKMTGDMETRRCSFTDPWQVEKRDVIEERKNIVSCHRGASRSRTKVEVSSVNGPEAFKTSSQGSFHWKIREQTSKPFRSGSFFAREAKKQIFERGKTTKSFEGVEVSGRTCTFGQMFSVQDRETRPKSLYSKLETCCIGSPFCSQKQNSDLGSSLVISNKVGSTNEYIRNIPRPKLLKSSSIVTETFNFTTKSEASEKDCCSGKKEAGTDKHHILNSENFVGNDNLESKDPRVSCEKQDHSYGADLEGSHSLDFKLLKSNNLSSVSDDNFSLRVHQRAQDDLEDSIHKEADGGSSSDVWDNLGQQKSSYDSPEGESILRCNSKDSELAINLREINQLSPDSVLEPLFKEENVAASEFFESPVSDLSSLAMKLHLLSPELEAAEGTGMTVSSDEDSENGSVDLSQNNEKLWGMLRPEESRDFSYLVDVLDEANLCCMNLDIWHGAESPVSASVFEALEKKYGKQTSWAKSERRLLFDHINSGLREILDSCMDFCMSTKPLRRRYTSTLRSDDIEEELWMLLSQEKEFSKDLTVKSLGREMKWMELEGDISITCGEIVEYLFDELAAELYSSESL